MDEEFGCCGCCSFLFHLLFCLTGRQPMRCASSTSLSGACVQRFCRPRVGPPPVIGLPKSHFWCRATSFGVQATDYQAPPASDPSGSSGQGVAQQADGSRRTTERAVLLPKVRIPCLQALKPLD